LTGVGGFVVSCDSQEVLEPADPNAFTEEQQRFADILAPNADGSLKSITIDIGDPSSRFYMPKLFRIELKLVNAKAGTLEITPYISKAPIANTLNKAAEMEPSKSLHWANIGTIVKRINGSEYSPTNTVQLSREDDNNPLTIAPYLAQLPDFFTFEDFKEYYTSASNLQKSYIINKTDELQLRIETETVGVKFEKIILPIKPVETLSLQSQIGN
jgi:hypothetical protein